MDLKSFVSESLTQILQGIKAAQSKPGGELVAADGYFTPEGNLLSGGTSGFFTIVNFDVLVFAESKDGAPDVRVGGIEVSENSSQTAQNSSRVKFAVHVRLPKGADVIKSRSEVGQSYTAHRDFNLDSD
jgi:hypothetical protein